MCYQQKCAQENSHLSLTAIIQSTFNTIVMYTDYAVNKLSNMIHSVKY